VAQASLPAIEQATATGRDACATTESIRTMPNFLRCQRCTACCRWPGQVRLTDAEIDAMAGYLGLAVHEFTEQFTRLREDRRGWHSAKNPTANVFPGGNRLPGPAGQAAAMSRFPQPLELPAASRKNAGRSHASLDVRCQGGLIQMSHP